MASFRKSLFVFGFVCVLPANSGWAQSPKASPELNLAEYRTVATARTAQVSGSRASSESQTGYLGVAVTRDDKGRLVIEEVQPDSPATKAGLKTGDVITRVGDHAVETPLAFREWLQASSPGAVVKLGLMRADESLEVSATLNATSRPMKRGPTGKKGEVAPTIWRQPALNLAVIGIDFADVKHNAKLPAAAWEEALFSAGEFQEKKTPTGQAAQGSLFDYFQEQSGGAFKLQGKVFDWITVAKKRSEYIQGSGTSNKMALPNDVLEKLTARDGKEALKGFDAILFLYAGDQYKTNRGAIYYPHAGGIQHQGKRWPYLLAPEGGTRMTSVNSLTKLTSQVLGLPDLAARTEDAGSVGLGVWCALSNPILEGKPQHLSAWAKEKLGWTKPAVIDPTVRQKLLLGPIEDSPNECFIVLIRPDGSEYYLLENRRKKGFDVNLPAEGLLIWHVIKDRPVLRASHGVEGPSTPLVHLGAVPYPSDANTAFTPDTIPSSRSPLGGGFLVHITNIVQLPDGRIAFSIGAEFR
jgi:M6 family metalloprotease-like protein